MCEFLCRTLFLLFCGSGSGPAPKTTLGEEPLIRKKKKAISLYIVLFFLFSLTMVFLEIVLFLTFQIIETHPPSSLAFFLKIKQALAFFFFYASQMCVIMTECFFNLLIDKKKLI